MNALAARGFRGMETGKGWPREEADRMANVWAANPSPSATSIRLLPASACAEDDTGAYVGVGMGTYGGQLVF